MTHHETFAAERLALLGKRDALIKEQQTLQQALSEQTDAMSDFCQRMGDLLLAAEAHIDEKETEIKELKDSLRQSQSDNKRQQSDLAALRRELAEAKKASLPQPAEIDDTSATRKKSLQRAMQKQRKDQFAHQHSLESRIAELTEQLSAKDAQIRTLQSKWEESQARCLALMERVQIQQDELIRLRPAPQPTEQADPAIDETDNTPSADPIIAELNRLARTLTVSVIGGSPTWQKKASEAFPALRFLGNQDFDSAKLLTTDVLLINTNHVSHSCTTKAADLAASRKAEICYTSKHNLTQIAELLCKRIKSILA